MFAFLFAPHAGRIMLAAQAAAATASIRPAAVTWHLEF
jgi:hypothetical protein